MPVRLHRLAAVVGLALGGSAFAQEPAAPAGPSTETLDALASSWPPRAGEERDEIETDRDSFTPATTTAGRGRLIVESAYSFLDNRGFKETHSFPELILRQGLGDRVELRLGWNYEVGGAGNEATGADAGEDVFGDRGRLVREATLSYGVKVRATDQDGWRPRSAVILQAATPTGGSAGTSTATQLIATAVAGWELPNRWRTDAAIRYGTASEAGDRFNLWAPSAVLRVPVGERWAVHAEYFGVVSAGRADRFAQHYFTPGVHCLLTPDLEVGVRVGWGLSDQSARFFTNVGFGWRL